MGVANVTVGKQSVHVYEGNDINLHYPLLQSYEDSDVYQCQRAGNKAKDQKSTVTVFRQGPRYTIHTWILWVCSLGGAYRAEPNEQLTIAK